MAQLTITSVIDFVFAVFFIHILHSWYHRKRRGSLPPGPRGVPFLGNALDIPSSHQWKTFSQWSDRWGSIVSVTVFGQTMVILNSIEDAIELLEKRSAIYSDRPDLVVGSKWVGWDKTLVLSRYGHVFREIRRMLSKFMGSRAGVTRYAPHLERETSNFVSRIWRRPDYLADEVRRSAGAIILKMGYGYEVELDEDPMLKTADEAIQLFSAITAPGAFLVDFFPILQHVPSWMPGSGWKSIAREAKKGLDAMCNDPFEFTRKHMANDTVISSFTSLNLDGEITPEREQIVKGAAATLYSGGADTTVSATHSFFLAMMCYPDVQKKAQQEIDLIIGTDRLPCLADRDQLPYLNALCLEVLRWNPVAPLGVAHRVTQDDTYQGYFIPEGTLIVPNIWKFLHDPERYHDPLDFKPERFVESDHKFVEPDPRVCAFGFGRRICPGLHLAEASIFLSCAMSLAVFDISKPVKNGVVVEPDIEYTSGTISHPRPFQCSIRPRSEKAESLLLSLMRDRKSCHEEI
ncbi:cytochrome P450 [Wolfiporia cocos MD-104 SS10]|uniref:Cytochrome P450 n=1 Tax=Wolfiporia cocos (strain MD-104) TaxID=742152 RepID=A0A2H3JTC6_WOLCO|nr:cytochrome P450 [Wolfiporia cocos MD-104 SS10]